MRGATSSRLTLRARSSNFNPRSSCEERLLKASAIGAVTLRFQSTLLMRGATVSAFSSFRASIFQSTLLMRGATVPSRHRPTCRRISIHAPHARSDRQTATACYVVTFQSTLLMRGATRDKRGFIGVVGVISIHAPHARSDFTAIDIFHLGRISIHAPHARSDATSASNAKASETFQSTLLMRGATLPVICRVP